LKDLQDFVIPISWTFSFTGIVHGIAGWFDIDLGGHTLSTAPNAERTHWQQVRFLLKEPLAVNAFDVVKGWMRLKVNSMRSYDVIAELIVGDRAPASSPDDPWVHVPLGAEVDAEYSTIAPETTQRRRGKWALHEQTYW
jgi:histone-arginine methyltransferase CARM1